MVGFDPEQIEFGGPATCRIVLGGRLQCGWEERLAGMSVWMEEADRETPRTILMGLIRDQAELKGVLDTLFGLKLPVLDVETV